MDLHRKKVLRRRLSEALADAHENAAEMLSVAFPALPHSAFEKIARTSGSALFFFFENEKKCIAKIALDFRTPFFPKVSLKNLDTAFSEKRKRVSLDEADKNPVPAPKIFIAGTFDEADARTFAALPTWQISRDTECTHVCAHFFPEKDLHAQSDLLLNDYERILAFASDAEHAPEELPRITAETEAGDGNYPALAARAIAEINSGKFEKIVLARARDFYFDTRKIFPADTLCAKLRNVFLRSGCTVFSARTSAGNAHERIVGATPEMLASLNNGIVETEALAGTVAHQPETIQTCADGLLSDAKELREHRLVVDFIAEKLRALHLKPQFSETPDVLALPNVLHLHTPIEATVPEASVSLGQIVAALHPTPAMCGVPAEKAKKFIIENETVPRENFSAPVGFIDADGNGFFAVAIRCAKIFDHKIRLYAGSGLVRGSVPEKEFSEINAKISALASRIKGSTRN